MFFNLIHYTIFRTEMVNFIPIYRYFCIYDVTKISAHRVLRAKQCCNSVFCFATKVQNTQTLYDTTIYRI